MKDEYIRKQDAVDALDRIFDNVPMELTTEILRLRRELRGLSPADVAPVVHAYWIPQKENHEFKEAWMKCSACGYPVSKWTGNTNFCPNCGAKMDGGDEHG